MFKLSVILIMLNCVFFTVGTVDDILSLPYCPDNKDSGLVIVSTLDGKLSALNSSGSLTWQIDTDPGPLLISNIHKLELTNNGEWIRIIPSLTGTLYKFDGSTIDPIPITAESLLKSSFRYSDDLVIAGAIEIRTYGIGFRTGKVFYECTPIKCSNKESQDVDDVLLLERSTHTIRAVEPRTGYERWNFSVGLHNIKLPRVSCIETSQKLFDWNLTAIVPEGKLKAYTIHNNVEKSWDYTFTAPIVRVWKWNGRNLTEINLFCPKHVPNIIVEEPLLPSIYIGMHNKQLYIHESLDMQDILHESSHKDLAVIESKSLSKIPWKPIPASTAATDDDATALSVLNASEYVNGNGYYLYSEMDLVKKDSLLCNKTNNSVIKTLENSDDKEEKVNGFFHFIFSTLKIELWCLFASMVLSLFMFWNQRYKNNRIPVNEKPVEHQVIHERKLSENDEQFYSRFEKEYDTLNCLGKGGFGVVFEVKSKLDECTYAIKRITLPDEKNSRDRVMREVKALAKLDHQNIVRYFSSWVEHPPLGWQKEHDKQWIGDRSMSFFEESAVTITTTNDFKRPKRSKSVSISISNNFDKIDFEDELSKTPREIDEDSDDDFIVFENESKSKSSENVDVTTDNGYTSSQISHSEVTTESLTDHIKKKIDWRRPDRKHHSLDLSQNSFVIPPKNPPVFLYIQMQLCQKESLQEWLGSQKERSYESILNIFLQILDAVEYVHLRGLIHRDLKPSNIFFSLGGQIKVGDFGLVKDMEDAFDLELIKKGSSPSYRGHTVEVGTHLYMSPEQSRGHIYDYKVDIYSLGLIFFELLYPFSTGMERIKTLTDLKNNILPKEFIEKYPDEHVLLQNMLCTNPNKRLTTIGIKARPPFNKTDTIFHEDCHFRLNNLTKN